MRHQRRQEPHWLTSGMSRLVSRSHSGSGFAASHSWGLLPDADSVAATFGDYVPTDVDLMSWIGVRSLAACGARTTGALFATDAIALVS